ncbi:MAG TPA: DinB family protein [Vicinamibacterales bacterium]
MNNTMLRAIVGVFAVGFLSLSASGQAQTDKVSLQAELLKDWAGLGETMHKIAAEMPADKYGFKPTPEQQTFGERTVHVATTNVYFLSLLGGTATKPTIDPKATSKDAALKALDDSFDYGTAILKQQTDPTLMQSVASAPKFMGPSSRARIIAFLVGHTWDIYGQMVVYLRLNGHVPPASQKM